MDAKMIGILEDVTIRPIPSRYATENWAEIRITFHWHFATKRITGLQERSAIAAAHRMAATIAEAMPAAATWCLPHVELVGSYRDVVETAITVELAQGSEAEKDAALDFLHDVIPPPEA